MTGIAVRKLSRLGNELYLTSSVAVAGIVPGHYDRGVVLVLLLRRCADDWHDPAGAGVGAGGGFRPPARITRSSSINAMAASLDRPYATIHRIVGRLKACGLVVEADRGVAISNDPAVAPTIVALLTLAHDSLVRLAEDLAPGMAFPPPRRDRGAGEPDAVPALRLAIAQAALDIWLVPFELARDPVTDWTSKLVWIVIVVANVRHITVDPAASARHAHTPTPDALRRPISTRRIAALSGIPYGTVYTHCQALAALDTIRHERGGWLMASRQLGHDEVDRGVHALLDYFRRRIVELTAAGFDPADAAAFYLAGRPAYAPLD